MTGIICGENSSNSLLGRRYDSCMHVLLFVVTTVHLLNGAEVHINVLCYFYRAAPVVPSGTSKVFSYLFSNLNPDVRCDAVICPLDLFIDF